MRSKLDRERYNSTNKVSKSDTNNALITCANNVFLLQKYSSQEFYKIIKQNKSTLVKLAQLATKAPQVGVRGLKNKVNKKQVL